MSILDDVLDNISTLNLLSSKKGKSKKDILTDGSRPGDGILEFPSSNFNDENFVSLVNEKEIQEYFVTGNFVDDEDELAKEDLRNHFKWHTNFETSTVESETDKQKKQLHIDELVQEGRGWEYHNIVDAKAINAVKAKLEENQRVDEISQDAQEMISKGVQMLMKNMLESCVEVAKLRTSEKSLSAYDFVVRKMQVDSGNEQDKVDSTEAPKLVAIQRGPDIKTFLNKEEQNARDIVKHYNNKEEDRLLQEMKAYDLQRQEYLETVPASKKKAAINNADIDAWWIKEYKPKELEQQGWDGLATKLYKANLARKHKLGKYNDGESPALKKHKVDYEETDGMDVEDATDSNNKVVDLQPSQIDQFLITRDDILEVMLGSHFKVGFATGSSVGISVQKAMAIE